MGRLRLAIRIDDPPYGPELSTAENMVYIAEKYNFPLTLAIQSGRLRDAPHLHPTYRRLFDKGLLDISCHGMYHEDFSGVNMFDGFKALSTEESDKVIKECQDFARSFFGKPYTLFIVPFFRLPENPNSIYKVLVENGFKSIGHRALMDPLGEGYYRCEGLYEIPYTVRFDFYHRDFKQFRGAVSEVTFRAAYEPSRYLRAIEEHIRFRFDNGLYVCLLTHELGFTEKPNTEADYPGGKLAVKFLERLLDWVTTRYPEVELVGMEELAK